MARTEKKTNGARTEAGAAYDTFKEFEGKKYTGMKVGRGHKWNYEPGEWIEKKVTPDKWEFGYKVVKRRKGKAPEGSGVPVGTEYHWYILAHQTVKKLDANSYETDMAGMKYKLAHKRADKDAWAASDRTQRKRLIQILKQAIAELEKEPAAEPVPALKKAARAAKNGAVKNGAAKKVARPKARQPHAAAA